MSDRLDRLLNELRAEFPAFRVVRKDTSRFQRFLHHALRVVTLGGQSSYLDGYQTTLGQTLYVTATWEEESEDERYITLRHEREHMRQFARYTRLGMGLLYLLLPLPLGLAWFRARFERAGYAETIRATAEVHGLARVESERFREAIIAEFVGPAYGWMWPFRGSLRRWYARVLDECRRADVERRRS